MSTSISLRLAMGLSAIAITLFGFGLYTSSAASNDDQVINSLGEVDSVRRLSLPTNDIVFNAADSKLYASVPGSTGMFLRRSSVRLRIRSPRPTTPGTGNQTSLSGGLRPVNGTFFDRKTSRSLRFRSERLGTYP